MKAIQVVVVFASIVVVLAGAVVMGTGIQVVSHPSLEVAGWQTYRLEFLGPPSWFYLGCVLLAIGATGLWCAKEKSRR